MKLLKKQTLIIFLAIFAILFGSFSLIPSSEKVEATETAFLSSGGKVAIDVTAEMEKAFTNLHYIENANYFVTNPLHGDNSQNNKDNVAGTCTTVAIQMLMGYHNYYTDRRLIPAIDENGKPFLASNYGNLAQHPDIDTSTTYGEEGLGRTATGTHDNFYRKLLELNINSDFPGLGQSYGSVLYGTNKFVLEYAKDIAGNVEVEDWGFFNDSSAKAELDNGKPLIVGCGRFDDMGFHVMVAYGYATYNSEEGYIVHMGYKSGQTKYWIPTSQLVYQARVTVNHTHNFIDTGRYFKDYYREIICSICGATSFETIFATDNEKKAITGLKYPLNNEEVILPNYVMHSDSSGKIQKENIVSIENGAFSGAMSDEKSYNISVPDSIRTIGAEAFKNCSSLNAINLGNVWYLGRRAFQGCANLKNITIYRNLSDLHTEDLLELKKLEHIYISSDNSTYSSVNGLLYSKDKKTLLLCPAAYSTKVFPVDSACEEIASYAFANNPNIQTLNLVNTKIIHSNSILNCSSLANIIAPKLEVAFPSAITRTKFTNERADITLGTVLLKKTSAGETVEIADDVKTIAPGAFVGNESVKKLVVKNHSFREIGDNAFKDCSTLENVEIYNLNEVVRLGTGAFDGVSANLKIKVPQKYLNSYKTETTKGWTSFASILSTFDKLSVKYVVGDKVVKESLVDYGNEIGEDYKYIDGDYYAKTWKTADGTEIKGYYMVTEDIVLYGKLEPYNFTITYVTNGGKPITQGKYNVENDQKLIEAKRTGYTFEGWYTSPDLAEESKIDLVIKKGTRTGNLTVYAKWSVNTYTVAFDPGVDMSAITAQDVVFDEPFTFITISSSGRIFNGWKDENGRLLTNANGVGLGKWDIGESTTVYADWILIEYTITYPNADLPGNPDKFTIEDLPLVLVLTTDSQARNDGWYLNPEFTGVKVTEINEIGDITLYAKWAYCYNISYQVLGGRFKDGVYPSCSFAYYGDSFILPTIWREGFIDGVWTYDGKEYPFGYEFTVYKNEERNDGIEFVVKWNPYYYKITFDFMGGTDGKNSKATREIMAAYYEIFPEIVLPVKAGYNFVGYGSSADRLYYEVKDGKVVRKTNDHVGDMTLDAWWEVAYPKLTIDGKNGSTWSIRIQNTSSAMVTFEYNKKMLFEKDAKVWNVNDNDKRNISINAGESSLVFISENWFATCIVVSMQLDDKRYITYAYNLNTDGTITCVNCYV